MVETVAQFGVVFLLFALGLEFSLSKLKVVGPVAVLGGLLQIIILIFLCGITAMVVKHLFEQSRNNSVDGQDCVVGLLFALLPVLGGNSGILRGMVSMGKLLITLSLYLAAASILSRLFVPRFLKLMMHLSAQ
ncbi:K(+) efflux antiporter 5 [Orobanche gracilis]